MPTGAALAAMALDSLHIIGGQNEARDVAFSRSGSVTLEMPLKAPGLYRLVLSAEGTESDDEWPLLRVDTTGRQSSWLALTDANRRDYTTLLDLAKEETRSRSPC